MRFKTSSVEIVSSTAYICTPEVELHEVEVGFLELELHEVEVAFLKLELHEVEVAFLKLARSFCLSTSVRFRSSGQYSANVASVLPYSNRQRE